MIKITNIFETTCKALFELEPTRPSRIYESELGEALAKKSPDYLVTKEGKIFKSSGSIRLDEPIDKLRIMQELAQEEFSEKIRKLRNKMEEFNLLKELTKKKERKDGKN